jgi:hypothetical protein
VIVALKVPCPFERPHVAGRFHNAKNSAVTPGISANLAELSIGEIVTLAARPDPIHHYAESIRKGRRVLAASGEQEMGDPLRALGPNSRELRQLLQ